MGVLPITQHLRSAYEELVMISSGMKDGSEKNFAIGVAL